MPLAILKSSIDATASCRLYISTILLSIWNFNEVLTTRVVFMSGAIHQRLQNYLYGKSTHH